MASDLSPPSSGRSIVVLSLVCSAIVSSTTAFSPKRSATISSAFATTTARNMAEEIVASECLRNTVSSDGTAARSLLDQAIQIRRQRQRTNQKESLPTPSAWVLSKTEGSPRWESLFSGSEATPLGASDLSRYLSDAKAREDNYDGDVRHGMASERRMLQRVHEQDITELTSSQNMLDVPDAELQLQIDAARKRASRTSALSAISSSKADLQAQGHPIANVASETGHRHRNSEKARQALFVEQVASNDASTVEKFAMRVIPVQLPAPLNRAASSTHNDETKETLARLTSNKGVSACNRQNATKRVSSHPLLNKEEEEATESVNVGKTKSPKKLSHEEEMRLIQIIHEGARLYTLKTDHEALIKRAISRQEWADLAQMSTSDLRRTVSQYRNAKSRLVSANMGLVHAVVRKLYRSDYGADGERRADLIQEGSLGLLRAAELFDPARGLRFSTYATIWIKGVLSNHKIDQTIAVPSREKNKWRKITRAAKDFREEHGDKSPSPRELADMCGLTVEVVEGLLDRMPKAQKILSLDYKYNGATKSGSSEGEETSLYGDEALVADADLAETVQMKADVVAALARNLDPREARLMRLRYGFKDGKTRSIEQCAEAMGLSRARVQQLAAGCLKKLREADDAKSLQEYLLTVV